MEPVNFQCGYCGQVLAVSPEHLGQMVQCPHCAQHVVAPRPEAPAPTAPAELSLPEFQPAPPQDEECIFSPATDSDDLFGDTPNKIVMPSQEIEPAAEPAPVPQFANEPPAAPPPLLMDVPVLESPAPTAVDTQPAEPWVAEPTQPAWQANSEEAQVLAGMQGDATLRATRRGGWYIALFIIPLFSWSVLATIGVFILNKRLETYELAPHPLENLPDLEGNSPTQRKKDASLSIPRPASDMALPDRLRLSLNETVQLGEVEVTPLSVHRGTIALTDDPRSGKKDALRGQALILQLRIKNCSSDLAFHPLDRFFFRYWNPTRRKLRWISEYPPYTQLVLGDKRFYGGPAGWADTKRQDEYVDEHPFWRQGNRWVSPKAEVALQPGQEDVFFVCTDPEDTRIDQELKKQRGKELEWRVHLRRGTTQVKGRRIPVSFVVGVLFQEKDIQPSGRNG